MIGQLEDLYTQFTFHCTLTLIGVLSQIKFGYTEITSVYSGDTVPIGVHLKLAVSNLSSFQSLAPGLLCVRVFSFFYLWSHNAICLSN